jgi:glycosyltransferase involved in cell wall biosynthesis
MKSGVAVPASGDQPIKVAIFIDDFSPTGVVTNALAIAAALGRSGCQVHLLAASSAGTKRTEVPEGVAVTALAENVVGTRRDRMRRSLVALRRALREVRPAVLFSAGNQGHLLSMLAAPAWPGCRTVVRISNDPDRTSVKEREGRVRRWWRSRKLGLIIGRADRIIVVSPHLLTAPALANPRLADRAIVIPNGVDLSEVQERAAAECPHPWLSGRRNDPVVLAVGRLVKQKNFATLIEALAIARRTLPLRLVIIGEGPEYGSLLSEAQALGVGEAMMILPHTSNPISYMARAAVVALPSWREGSSNVLLEAIACDTPVVASRTAGSAAEVLDGGHYGVLVDPGDAAGMAAALLRQAGAEAIRPGDRALAFSRRASLHKYVEVITSLCEASGPVDASATKSEP